MNHYKKIAYTAAALAMLGSGAANANLILNGSFETAPVEYFFGGDVTINPLTGASDGLRAVSFNGGNTPPNGFLGQNFATTAGQQYQLQFDYGNFGVNPVTQFLVAQVLSSNIVLFQTVVSPTASRNPTPFNAFNFFFTANSGSSTLLFSDVITNNTISNDGVLDNIRVTAFNPQAVPEPSILALLGLGMLGFAFNRRRKSIS